MIFRSEKRHQKNQSKIYVAQLLLLNVHRLRRQAINVYSRFSILVPLRNRGLGFFNYLYLPKYSFKINITIKKVITICLLVATLLVGAMTIDAKTTKKNTKARTTNSGKTETYTELERQFILPSELVTKEKGMKDWLSSHDDILKHLKNKGFKITYDNFGRWETAYKEVIDSKTGKKYSMELYWCCGAKYCTVAITFATKQDARKFYNKIKQYNNNKWGWCIDDNTIVYEPSYMWDVYRG